MCVAVEADIQGREQGDWGAGEVRGRLLRRRHLTVHHLPHGGGSVCCTKQTNLEVTLSGEQKLVCLHPFVQGGRVNFFIISYGIEKKLGMGHLHEL